MSLEFHEIWEHLGDIFADILGENLGEILGLGRVLFFGAACVDVFESDEDEGTPGLLGGTPYRSKRRSTSVASQSTAMWTAFEKTRGSSSSQLLLPSLRGLLRLWKGRCQLMILMLPTRVKIKNNQG